jgi:hypothetical protein
MVAGKLTSLEAGANQHTKGQGTSIDVASKLLNVGRASIDRARKVLATGDPALVAAVEEGSVSVSAAANEASDKKKGKQTKHHRDPSPKQLKKQIDDFETEWEQLNGSQKRHFVRTNQHELAELLEELEGLEGMIEEEEAQPSPS